MSHLFSPYTLGPLTLANRIVVAPMCQYSADEGARAPGIRSTSGNWRSLAPGC